ncbi:MAG: DUF47 family protein, partial [Planctomycetota bacterium]|nr:DUF47 family protein [Planctomycetota bacterium]
MSILDRLFAESPFKALSEHTEKVHACVELVRPLVEALLVGDHERILELHDVMSKTEYEADLIKTEIRKLLSGRLVFSVNRKHLSRYLAYQDDVADAAEDFAVVLSLRRTKIHPDLKNDLREFAEQVVQVSESLLAMAKELVYVTQRGFTGEPAQTV